MVFISLRAAPSKMVLGRVFAKQRAVLFCTKSYFPLVGGTSPIPLNKLIAWLRNSYESLFSSVGIFFRNKKRGEPISLKLTDSPLELSSDIVFSDSFLLLLFITFKELVDIIFCSLNLLPLEASSDEAHQRHSWQPYEAGFPVCALPGISCCIRIYDNPHICLWS